MKKFKTFSKRLMTNAKGQGMVEYILLLVVIVAIATVFKKPIMDAVSTKVGDLGQKINDFQGN